MVSTQAAKPGGFFCQAGEIIFLKPPGIESRDIGKSFGIGRRRQASADQRDGFEPLGAHDSPNSQTHGLIGRSATMLA